MRTSIGVSALAAVGIKVRVVADDAECVGDYTGGAEEVFDVVDRTATGGKHSEALATEENVIGCSVAAAVCFGEDVASQAVDVVLASGL